MYYALFSKLKPRNDNSFIGQLSSLFIINVLHHVNVNAPKFKSYKLAPYALVHLYIMLILSDKCVSFRWYLLNNIKLHRPASEENEQLN